MHLLVPFASDTSEACRQVLGDLRLPNLARLLTELSCTHRDDAAATSFSPPHERALAGIRHWQGSDGAWPFAAQAAAGDGVVVGGEPWGLVTPAHWLLGRDRIVMLDPASMPLDEDDSRTLFTAVRGLFESDGLTTAWGSAGRWYIGHPGIGGMTTASVDRVVGRDVDDWLSATPGQRAVEAGPASAAAGRGMHRLLRRLQSEAQLVLYTHPVNEGRERRGELTVNSFWLSGCGSYQPSDASDTPVVDASLRTPLLAGDWSAWADAWRALDAGVIAHLRSDSSSRSANGSSEVMRAGSGEALTLTLCGERSAVRYERRPQSLLRRLRGSWQTLEPGPVLESL